MKSARPVPHIAPGGYSALALKVGTHDSIFYHSRRSFQDVAVITMSIHIQSRSASMLIAEAIVDADTDPIAIYH